MSVMRAGSLGQGPGARETLASLEGLGLRHFRPEGMYKLVQEGCSG